MQKKFVTNLAILVLLNLLIKPFWTLGIEPAVQDIVGNSNYGEYFALFNFSFLLNILLDFGITNFNNKNIAQNNHLLSKHLSSLVVLKLMLALVYMVVTIGFGLLIGYDLRLMKLLLVLCFNMFLTSFILYLRSNLLGLHLFKTDSIISVLDRVIMISICVLIIWGHVGGIQMDIMLFVYIQTAAYVITALVGLVTVAAKAEFMKLKWSLPFSIMILKKSFPFAILILLMTFYNRIDAVMIERLLPAKTDLNGLNNGPDQAGIYAKAFRLLDATNMIAFLVSVQLLPIFSRMLKYKESVEQLVKLSFTLLITPAVVIAIGCFFYQEDMMILLYGNEHIQESSEVFCLLMMCFIAISTTYVFGTLLTANGNLRELNIMAFCGMLLNIGLNFVLIHYAQAKGSALVSMITQFATGIAQVLIVQKIFRFKVNYRLLVRLALFAGGVIAINYLSRMPKFLWEAHPSLGWTINFSLMVTASVFWAFITGLLSLKSMFRIMKYG